MADGNKQLDIRISVTADTKGATQAANDLQSLDDQIRRQTGDNLDLTDATKKYIKELEDQDAEEKRAIASKVNIRRGLGEIGRELPLLGELGRIAMEPLIGGFVLLATAISRALDSIAELGNRSTPEFTQMTEAIEKQRDAMEEVDLAAHAYQRSLEALSKANESVRDSSQAYLSNLNARGSAETAAANKTQEQQTAILETAEKLGLITHQQYINKKLALDEQYARARLKIENDLASAAVIEKYREQYNTRTEAAALQKGMKGKVDAASQAAGKSEFAAGRQATDEENLKKTQEKIQELQKEQVELHDKTTGLGRFQTMEPQYVLEQKKKQNDQEMADSLRIADQLRERIKLDRESKADAADAAAAAKEDLDRDRSRLTQDTGRLHELDRELPRDTAQMQQGIKELNAQAGLDSSTRAIKAIGASAENIQATGGSIQADLGKILGAVASNQTGLQSVISQHLAVTGQHTQDLNKLKDEVSALNHSTRR